MYFGFNEQKESIPRRYPSQQTSSGTPNIPVKVKIQSENCKIALHLDVDMGQLSY